MQLKYIMQMRTFKCVRVVQGYSAKAELREEHPPARKA